MVLRAGLQLTGSHPGHSPLTCLKHSTLGPTAKFVSNHDLIGVMKWVYLASKHAVACLTLLKRGGNRNQLSALALQEVEHTILYFINLRYYKPFWIPNSRRPRRPSGRRRCASSCRMLSPSNFSLIFFFPFFFFFFFCILV
jgi:hypothetical protein